MKEENDVKLFVYERFIKPIEPLLKESEDNGMVLSEIQITLTQGLLSIYQDHSNMTRHYLAEKYLNEFFPEPEKKV